MIGLNTHQKRDKVRTLHNAILGDVTERMRAVRTTARASDEVIVDVRNRLSGMEVERAETPLYQRFYSPGGHLR